MKTIQKDRIESLRAKLKELSDKRRKSLVHPVKNPRYDEVFAKGAAWLDSL